VAGKNREENKIGAQLGESKGAVRTRFHLSKRTIKYLVRSCGRNILMRVKYTHHVVESSWDSLMSDHLDGEIWSNNEED